jgi:hypothetical protein
MPSTDFAVSLPRLGSLLAQLVERGVTQVSLRVLDASEFKPDQFRGDCFYSSQSTATRVAVLEVEYEGKAAEAGQVYQFIQGYLGYRATQPSHPLPTDFPDEMILEMSMAIPLASVRTRSRHVNPLRVKRKIRLD